MTFVIIFVFILCWSPYIVFDLLQVVVDFVLGKEKKCMQPLKVSASHNVNRICNVCSYMINMSVLFC